MSELNRMREAAERLFEKCCERGIAAAMVPRVRQVTRDGEMWFDIELDRAMVDLLDEHGHTIGHLDRPRLLFRVRKG